MVVERLKVRAADGDGQVFHHLLRAVFRFFADPRDGAGRLIDIDDDAAFEPAGAGGRGEFYLIVINYGLLNSIPRRP